MNRYLTMMALFLMVAVPCFALSGSGGSGGSSSPPTISSSLQQPVMFVGSGPMVNISATTTTGTITNPLGLLNGDLELEFIGLNNATSSAFTPPAGWTLVPSCASQGNTATVEVFQHTASSEGATTAATTWTTNGTGNAFIVAYRNASVDVCAATTAASGTGLTVGGITAAATTDRVVNMAFQVGQHVVGGATLTARTVDMFASSGFGSNEVTSYPITNTTVGSYAFTSNASAVWSGAMIGLSFAANTTAGAFGALTNNQTGSFLNYATLTGASMPYGTVDLSVTSFSLLMTPTSAVVQGGIGYHSLTSDTIFSVLNVDNSSGTTYLIEVGDPLNPGATINMNAPVVATTNSITTSTGAISTTGGGSISTTGGSVPTCSGGSGTCVTVTGSTNNRGQIHLTGGTAVTSITLTFATGTGVAFPQAPFCNFTSGTAVVAGLFSPTGACGAAATCVVGLTSTSAADINYQCF